MTPASNSTLTTCTLARTRLTPGGEFAADDDDDVMDEDDYEDDRAQAGLASKADLREMLAKARGENLDQQWNSDQALPEKGKKPAYNRPDEPSDPPLQRKTTSHPKSSPRVSPLPAPTLKRREKPTPKTRRPRCR